MFPCYIKKERSKLTVCGLNGLIFASLSEVINMWRVAESLEILRKQLNEAFPNRSKVSDGSIGDSKHASRNSDHNPHIKDKNGVGVVTARDYTHDPKNGLDCNWLAKKLVESRDKRIKYIIWNKQILSSKNNPWKWRPYNGANAHTKHLHLSVNGEQKIYDDRTAWDLDIAIIQNFENLKESEIKFIPQVSEILPKTETIKIIENQIKQNEKEWTEGDQVSETATETVTTATANTTQGEVIQTVEKINQQPVNETVEIVEPEKQGVFAKLTSGVGALFSGTVIYTVFEKLGAVSLSQTVLILLIVVIIISFVGFCFWAVLDAWKAKSRLALEIEAKTRTDRKDFVWISPEDARD